MSRTLWRWFPQGMIGAMAVVFAVNGYMVYDALHTFPGQAGQDGFDLSNQYNRVLATTEEQDQLGWRLVAGTTPARVPTLRLTARDGTALTATEIKAEAERPVGPPDTTTLNFKAIGNGQYQADKSLFSGQWDILLTVRANGRAYTTTQRVVAE